MMYFSVFFNLVQSNILTLLALSMITFPQKLIKVYVVLFLLFFFETWIIDVNQLNDLYYGFAYFFSIVFYAKCIAKISYREYIIPALLMLSLVTFVYVLPTCFENNLNALVYSIENGFILVIVKHVLKVILLFVTLQIGYSLARVFTNELKYFHIFLLVLVFSQMLLICLKESLQVATIQRYYSLLGILLLLIVDMLLGYLFYRVQIDHTVNQNKNKSFELLQQYQESLKPLVRVNSEVKIIRHDLKNSFGTLLMYLKRNKNNEAIEYLQQKCVQIDNIDPLITSNATTIDLVVNTKKQIALQKNIKTSISIQLSKQPNMDEFDLCCLLGNALDNAIEHIGGERIINLRILGNNITTKIVISNSVDRSILKYNPLLKTSKLDKYHGFGILSMRETVKKYHGIIQFSERKGYFICTITLFN